MRDFVRGHLAGTLRKRAVAITFDDGYLDNFQAAAPILRSAGAPATLFLASGPAQTGSRYWWDELARLLFDPAALDGRVMVGRQSVAIALPAMRPGERPGRAWRAWHEPATERQALHLKLWQDMRVLPASDIDRSLGELRDLRGGAAGDDASRAMSPREVAALAAETTFSLEGHTIDHPDLTSRADEEVVAQVRGGMAAIEALTGRAAAGFAYPYGRCDARVQRLVRSAGVTWACTTQGGPVRPGCDALALPRMTAADTPDLLWAGIA